MIGAHTGDPLDPAAESLYKNGSVRAEARLFGADLRIPIVADIEERSYKQLQIR